MFFFDDDAVVRDDYVRNALALFAPPPEIVGLIGGVLLDGAVPGEIAEPVAAGALARCDFALSVKASEGLRGDGRLPLYS